MAKQDYYATLGVARGASADELKKAYRKLAMQYHPDRNPGDAVSEGKFKEAGEAYDCLKDEQKRAAYDRFGHAAFENGGPGQRGGFDFNDAGNLGDIFDQMFGDMMGGNGRRGGNGGRRPGADLRAQVEITLAEAFTGTERTLRVPTRVVCDACAGTGSETRDRSQENCPQCGGTGKVRAQQGFFVVERTCPTCGGMGRVIKNPCRICQGQGTVQRDKSLKVAIPAGIEDGTRIRVPGEGESGGQGAQAGDLYVQVAIRAHELFQRDGANVFLKVPLRLSLAALGGEIDVPSIDGSSGRVKIPPGTQTGAQFRLRAKGFSVLRSAARGDMYIQVAVETPQNLTRRQRELLEEFEAESKHASKGHPEADGFAGKVKEFFGHK